MFDIEWKQWERIPRIQIESVIEAGMIQVAIDYAQGMKNVLFMSSISRKLYINRTWRASRYVSVAGDLWFVFDEQPVAHN